jgi:hypothetical protein
VDQEQGRREQNQVGAGAHREGREASSESIEQDEQRGARGSGAHKGGGARFIRCKNKREENSSNAYKAGDCLDGLPMRVRIGFPSRDGVAVEPSQGGEEEGREQEQPFHQTVRLPKLGLGPYRKKASSRKQNADQDGPREERMHQARQAGWQPAAGVDGGEVGQSGSGDGRVRHACGFRNAGNYDPEACGSGKNGKRRQNPAVPPVEVMAVP